MKKVIAVILSISIIFFSGEFLKGNKIIFANNTKSTQLTQKQKLDDFEYMYKILKDNYPYFDVNKRLNRVDWLANKNKYISEIKSTANDKDFLNALNSILSELNNGHTDMLDKGFYEYAKSAFKLSPNLNSAWLNQLNNSKAVARYASMTETKNGLGLASNSITPNNVKTGILLKNKVAYLSIHMLNIFNLNGDMKIIKPFLRTIKNYKALIIDIRGNSGGDAEYWSDNIVPMLINKPITDNQYVVYRGGSFAEQFFESRSGMGYDSLNSVSDIDTENLKKLPPEVKKNFKYYDKYEKVYTPKDSVGFKGKIYLLVDGSVFSSSEAFASFAKSTGFATLVGEKTGGDGIGSDPALCTLPNSGYIFRFTKEMGLTSDGACNFESKTEPDIKVSAKMGSNFSNDMAIQTVLKLIK